MYIYDMTAAGQPNIFISAMSSGDAVDLFTAFWLLNKGCEMPDLQVRRANTSIICDQEKLQEAFARSVFGIVVYCYNHGWTIYPPERFEEIG